MRWGKPRKNKKKIDPRYFLKESSLSRIYEHILAHDTAALTAFRDNPFDSSSCTGKAVSGEAGGMQMPLPVDGEPQRRPDDSYKANLRRNKELKATLLTLGYGVTRIDGTYIEKFNTEAAKEVKEDSFFAVNLSDDPAFIDNIKNLGERFCQDSVLIVPRGGKGAYLYGTNDSEFPGYGESFDTGDFKGGEEAEFMSRVGGRPYTFGEELILETLQDHGRNARWVIRKMSDKILNKSS
jgi:hypothetical protein